MKRGRVLIIEGRFYDDIADELLQGAAESLAVAGVAHESLTVPGILEIPAALLFAAGGSKRGAFRGFVVLGCAIKGETEHYEHVCEQAMAGVREVTLALGLAVGSGILTCPTYDLALERARRDKKNIGGQAGRACVRMMAAKRQLRGHRGLSTLSAWR